MAAKGANGPQGNLSDDQMKTLPKDLMRAKKYTLHKVPAWLTKRLRAQGRTLAGNGDWRDHMGSYKASDGTEVFVSEPYDLTGDKLRGALEFADSVEAFLHVSPVSSWYPGVTVRLEFWPEATNIHLTESGPMRV